MRNISPIEMAKYDNYNDIISFLNTKLVSVPINIRKGLVRNLEVWKQFLNYIPLQAENVAEPEKKIKYKVCVTGKLEGISGIYTTRKEFVKYIAEHLCMETGINQADYLVCNTQPSYSQKFKKAIERSIPIVTEMELLKIICK
jgi:NAD-dependent DNA ligase